MQAFIILVVRSKNFFFFLSWLWSVRGRATCALHSVLRFCVYSTRAKISVKATRSAGTLRVALTDIFALVGRIHEARRRSVRGMSSALPFRDAAGGATSADRNFLRELNFSRKKFLRKIGNRKKICRYGLNWLPRSRSMAPAFPPPTK